MSENAVPTLKFPQPLTPDGLPDPLLLKATRNNPVLRVIGPGGNEAWLVAGEREVREVLSEPARFTSQPDPGLEDKRAQAAVPMVGMDPPEHTRIRRLAAKVFTARRIQVMVPAIKELVESLLDDVEEKGPGVDLISTLALPLPMSVIFRVLGGVPDEDKADLRRWSEVFISLSTSTAEEIETAVVEFHNSIQRLVVDRRQNLGDDLLSDLIRARDGRDALTEEELIATTGLIIIAGHETTAKAITRGVMVLSGTGQWSRIAAGEIPMEQVVEEVLRHQPPIDTSIWRTAKVDTELAGRQIRAGEQVLVSLNLANLDPTARMAPLVFDAERTDAGHMTFGYGAHFCLGAALARAEMVVAFEGLARRFPNLRLAVEPGELEWSVGSMLNAPVELPVTW
ncbi:Cytochrome P450 monooxygenase PikC [Streptomyces sp. enrichment culture]|uniref:cytochrome P450 family protein n=1 Tax=Streptomyces sp. enrichment culture TaxID=1795815 RepID=UPI003F54E565